MLIIHESVFYTLDEFCLGRSRRGEGEKYFLRELVPVFLDGAETLEFKGNLFTTTLHPTLKKIRVKSDREDFFPQSLQANNTELQFRPLTCFKPVKIAVDFELQNIRMFLRLLQVLEQGLEALG